jgi:hypothetical protein
MKTNQKLIIVLAVLLSMAVISQVAWAKRDTPPAPPPCGLTGTWAGDAEGDLAWLAIHTSTDGLKGEMLMNWVHNDLISPSDEMAPGHGVWELIDSETGKYSYTWYSQIKSIVNTDLYEFQITPIRVYGTAQMQGCDTVFIEYTFEFQPPPDQESGESSWIIFDKGIAYETRLKVYIPELE